MTSALVFRRALDAAATYIDRLEAHVRRGENPPDLSHCQRMYAHHKLQLHTLPVEGDPEARIHRLDREYPDGWVMSLSAPSLKIILPMCGDVRVGAWVKPFAVFKPNVNPAYAWEPVIFKGGRPYTRQDGTVRDWVAESITLKRGLTGAKPREFCRWVFSLLNAQKGDTLDDIFPGTGAVGAAWAEWVGDKSPLPQLPLECTR